MKSIIWKVAWSWVFGMRAFVKNDLVPPTPILLTVIQLVVKH